MSILHFATLRRIAPTVILAATTALVTVFAMHFFGPQQLSAQQSNQGDVRATSFELVDSNGTVLAELKKSTSGNGGVLNMNSPSGDTHTQLLGVGAVWVLDNNGTGRVFLGKAPDGTFGLQFDDANGTTTNSYP